MVPVKVQAWTTAQSELSLQPTDDETSDFLPFSTKIYPAPAWPSSGYAEFTWRGRKDGNPSWHPTDSSTTLFGLTSGKVADVTFVMTCSFW
jgi:hypothetical protein